jgi:glyoxylase-like metal-dependent hydrolase (beta-lactamase superfamily II)
METRVRLILGAVWVLAAGNAIAAPATEADYPMRAQPVAPNLYAVISPARDFPSPENKGWNSNSAFAVTKGGVLVIDSGSSETVGKALRKVIAGVTDKPVRWIINTHGHGDHWLGNAALADARTEIIASSTVRNRIEKEGADWVARFNTMTNGATGASRVLKPNHVYDARVAIAFGDLKAELIPSQDAHSPGDLLVWLPQQKVLIGGDVLYSERAPATFDSRLSQWIVFLRELEALQPVKIVPGHGPVAAGAAVGHLRRYFEDLWKVVEAGYQEGKPDFEILPQARQVMAQHKPHFPDLDTRIGESVSHTYLQVEAAEFK